jgi:hypothetical protein
VSPKNPAAVSLGRRGGKAGKGESKRRDQNDPDYYHRISKQAVAARKAKRAK